MAVVLPGWYGKLPALGDFASRRLPPEFVEPWDRWLAAGLAAWREHDADWLDAFSVYGAGGTPCPRCGSRLRTVVLKGRSTTFCRRCQVRAGATRTSRRR